jgi:hypothetical protein
MVEGTLALSIPGLVLTCNQYFVLLQLGHNFEHDFGSCHLELRWIEVRIQRWAKAAGVIDQTHEAFTKNFESEHSPEDVALAYDTWEQIALQLRRAKEDSEKILQKKRNPAELIPLDEEQQLKACDPETTQMSRFLRKVRKSYEVPLQASSKLAAQGKWALYKRTQLQDLVKTVREHITALESILPEQERGLVTAEVAQMEEGVFRALSASAKESDPLLAKAMKSKASSNGFLWEDIKNSGSAKVHLGSNHNQASQHEGSSTWRGMVNDGNARVHAGNNYGSAAFFNSQQ